MFLVYVEGAMLFWTDSGNSFTKVARRYIEKDVTVVNITLSCIPFRETRIKNQDSEEIIKINCATFVRTLKLKANVSPLSYIREEYIITSS